MPLKILAKPAFSNKARNPYNWLLYRSMLESAPCEVDEFTPCRALLKRYDIFHMHWPDVMLAEGNLLRSVVTVAAFLFLMRWMKWRGTRMVWTLHNLRSHDYPYKKQSAQRLERWYLKQFAGLLDGVVGLSASSLEEATVRYPGLARTQSFVIPHGHYKEVYPDATTRRAARDWLGVDQEGFLLSYFGQIRPYKNVAGLIEAFRRLGSRPCELLIAGKPAEASLGAQLRRLGGDSGRIRFMLEFIPDDEVQFIFRASDLVVFPYKEVLNSGSVLLALSFDVPVLVPDRGSMNELRNRVGDKWVQTYSGQLTGHKLEQAIAAVAGQNHGVCEPVREFGWERIARQTLEAYRRLIEA